MTTTKTEAARTFRATAEEIGRSGASDTVLDYYEYQARISARTDEHRAAALEAALLFVEGFDTLATEYLASHCGPAMAVRLVRRARIQAADSPALHFPRRAA